MLGQELFEGVEVVSEIKRVAKNKANNCFCQMVDDARIISQKQLMGYNNESAEKLRCYLSMFFFKFIQNEL